MIMRHTPSAITFALSLVAATTLMAQAPSSDVDAVTATPALRVQRSSGVQFLNGGTGSQERDAMLALRDEFPLQIVFSGRAGAYGMADQVRVRNASGQVVAVPHAGPMLMVKLPPGRYTVEADFHGHTERRGVEVGSGPQVLRWTSPLVSSR